jgi:hypothetical protein
VLEIKDKALQRVKQQHRTDGACMMSAKHPRKEDRRKSSFRIPTLCLLRMQEIIFGLHSLRVFVGAHMRVYSEQVKACARLVYIFFLAQGLQTNHDEMLLVKNHTKCEPKMRECMCAFGLPSYVRQCVCVSAWNHTKGNSRQIHTLHKFGAIVHWKSGHA